MYSVTQVTSILKSGYSLLALYPPQSLEYGCAFFQNDIPAETARKLQTLHLVSNEQEPLASHPTLFKLSSQSVYLVFGNYSQPQRTSTTHQTNTQLMSQELRWRNKKRRCHRSIPMEPLMYVAVGTGVSRSQQASKSHRQASTGFRTRRKVKDMRVDRFVTTPQTCGPNEDVVETSSGERKRKSILNTVSTGQEHRRGLRTKQNENVCAISCTVEGTENKFVHSSQPAFDTLALVSYFIVDINASFIRYVGASSRSRDISPLTPLDKDQAKLRNISGRGR